MSDSNRFKSSSIQAPLRRNVGWLAATCVLAGMTAWACGDSASGGAGGLGGEGATSSASTSKATSATKASASTATTAAQTTSTADTTSGGLGCNPPAVPPSNGMCVTLTSGAGTTASSSSGGGGGGTSASSGTGGPLIECNPVTNEPCEAGFACDTTMGGGFACFEPPNDAVTCGDCAVPDGPFCEGGNTCAGDVCVHFCCTDADCGDVPCVIEDGGMPIFPETPGLGICPIG